jgi:prepilin-type N-terminal cleavage/methylation domain-containing protein
MGNAQAGFSVIELLMAAAIATVMMSIVMTSFRGLVETSRRDGAAGLIAGDVRRARARAISTGWQYRIYGFTAGATSPYKNQYRLMGRSSSGVAWPDPTSDPIESATQMAGGWVDLRTMYPGVTLSPDAVTADFSVAFDSRGVRVAVDPSFDPLIIDNQKGPVRSVRVSAVGSVEIQ